MGNYLLVAGWAVEPPSAGEKNAVTLRVAERGTMRAVLGLEQALRLEVRAESQAREMELGAVFGEPGSYRADLIPTREGDYRFRFFGTIEGMAVDETFDSRDGRFDGVASAQELQLPDTLPPPALMNRTAQEAERRALAAENAVGAAPRGSTGCSGAGGGVPGRGYSWDSARSRWARTREAGSSDGGGERGSRGSR